MIKIIGAVLIITGCSGVGFLMVNTQKREEQTLRQLIGILDFMGCELQYRLTPLPELCRLAAVQGTGMIHNLMMELARELDKQISPDASACMTAVLQKFHHLPDVTRRMLVRLGGSLGRFDLSGQIRGIENTRQLCRKELDVLSDDRGKRYRNYRTLAICAGIALAIIFI